MLEELQEAVAERIRLCPDLAPVREAVLTRKESDVDGLVEENLSTKLGLAVVVLYPFPRKTYQNVPGLACEMISVQVQVAEQAATNDTGISCLKCAELLHRLLHLWTPPVDGLQDHALVAPESDPWRDPPTAPGRNEIVLEFLTGGEMPPLP